MILIIDNYDSFTYNIVSHYLTKKLELKVIRNDEMTVADMLLYKPERIIISPGPKTPKHAGYCLELIQYIADLSHPIPIFGVCLGCQALAQAFGANIVVANKLFHGKVSQTHHDEKGVFYGLESPLVQTRYHSLVIEAASLHEGYEISAKSEDDEIMAIRHKTLPFEGVQFHPESIASIQGMSILDNVLRIGSYVYHRGK